MGSACMTGGKKLRTDLAELKQVAVGINNGFVHVLDWQKSFHLPTERSHLLP